MTFEISIFTAIISLVALLLYYYYRKRTNFITQFKSIKGTAIIAEILLLTSLCGNSLTLFSLGCGFILISFIKWYTFTQISNLTNKREAYFIFCIILATFSFVGLGTYDFIANTHNFNDPNSKKLFLFFTANIIFWYIVWICCILYILYYSIIKIYRYFKKEFDKTKKRTPIKKGKAKNSFTITISWGKDDKHEE